MLIKDLISRLKKFPRDLEVIVDGGEALWEITDISVSTVIDKKSVYFSSEKYTEYATIDDLPEEIRNAVILK